MQPEQSTTVRKERQCEDCGDMFRYGDIIVRAQGTTPKSKADIICETCMRKRGGSANAVVYGAGKPSSVARDRAMRNLKRLERAKRRGG
jgi:hypothetical protein